MGTDPNNKMLAMKQYQMIQKIKQKNKERKIEAKRMEEMKRREEFELNLRKKQFLESAAKINKKNKRKRRKRRKKKKISQNDQTLGLLSNDKNNGVHPNETTNNLVICN